MFEWLERELTQISTPRFHMVDGSMKGRLRDAVIASNVPLPSAYKRFVLRFGTAKLYRRVRSDSYHVGVFAAPRDSILPDGSQVCQLGFHDGATVYIKGPCDSERCAIFEHDGSSEEEVAEDFEQWLSTSCSQARAAYSTEEWEQIVHGPLPFSDRERVIIEARKMIRWRPVRVDENGDRVFEVSNNSELVLPFLTIGVRTMDGRLNGTVRLGIGDLKPGQTHLVRHPCYKDLVSPEEIEVYDLPQPNPEDRERYGELLSA